MKKLIIALVLIPFLGFGQKKYVTINHRVKMDSTNTGLLIVDYTGADRVIWTRGKKGGGKVFYAWVVSKNGKKYRKYIQEQWINEALAD